MKKIIALLCFSSLIFMTGEKAGYCKVPEDNQISIMVRANDQAVYYSRLSIFTSGIVKDLLKKNSEETAVSLPNSNFHVSIKYKGKMYNYLVNNRYNLVDESTLRVLVPNSSVHKKLISYIEQVKLIHFGELAPWEQVNTWIPKGSKFRIVDLQSGIEFGVQRRAGSRHADVQPLTSMDSKLMKQIYDGKWSWKRKAVLVLSGGHAVAASMNGMPHGGDGISGNGFSGHFCLHFLNSSTHKRRQADPAHQLMVYKAAGKLDKYMRNSSPNELVERFITAMEQGEPQVIRMALNERDFPLAQQTISEMNQIKVIRPLDKLPPEQVVTEKLETTVRLQLYLERKTGRPEKPFYSFSLSRSSLADPWQIVRVVTDSKPR